MRENRQPLLDFLSCLSEADMDVLFNILDVAKQSLILESAIEHSVFDEFMTVMFIAAKAQKILK